MECARRWWTLAWLGMTAACAPVVAQYPSWEPTSPLVYEVRDRRLALADLQVSRELWHDRNLSTYSYLRASQISAEEVTFTFVVVDKAVVVERSLLTTFTDERGLGDRMARKTGQPPRLLWRERGREVGRHQGAAPPLTVDQLYDLCRDRVLSARHELVPRLSFHVDGLLQHCGFLSDDCPDCPVASMQTVGWFTPHPWQTPPDVLCPDRFGLFLHLQSPLGGWPCEVCHCEGTNWTDPHPPPAPPKPAPLTPEQRELCRLSGAECPEEPGMEQDICKIDPRVCPPGELLPNRANWVSMYLAMADCRGFGVSPTPACTALPRPTSASDPAWQQRCRPAR
jgi:hypothetical protein